MSNKWLFVILLITSAVVHFSFFGHPSETVFDEVHFGKFVSGYYTGQYYFDIHPPLGKLIIAGFAKLFDFQPQYSFTNIGDKFPDNKYLSLRFPPALAGTLLPIIIYLIILELGMSRAAAFTGGMLVILDNALLTQSRLILLDPFLLLFGFLSLLFYFKSRSSRSTFYFLLSTFFSGLAISIKWTGLSFLALPVLIESWDCVKNSSYKKFINQLAFFILIPTTIYFLFFVIHFKLLPAPGSGDAFMKPNFRHHSLVKNIWDLNVEMYKSNQRLGATHPYGSTWETWPFMARPIFYWVDSAPSTDSGQASSPQVKEQSRIYFIGNPIIWWASAIAVVYSILHIVYRKFNTTYHIPHTTYLLLGGYVLNLLPFIGIKRVMFLYHYLAALIFSVLILVYLIDKTKNAKRNFGILTIVAISTFVFFAPLSYGLQLSDKAHELRIWFAGWR